MNRAILALLALIALSFGHSPALAQAPGYIQQYNAVCDPGSPKHCAAPDINGALPITGSITLSNPTIGAAVPATGNYVAGNKAGNLTGVTLDGSSNLNVNCQSGCAGGSFNNNADGVATSATNGQAAAWLYGWNGATWDRVRVDANKYLNVDIQTITASLPAGSNVIGHVITDTGSTTVVTGTVAVTQSGTWSGLRVVGNAGAAFDATIATGSAPTNMVVGGAVYNSTEITATNGQTFGLQGDSKGRLRMIIGDGAANSRFANVTAGNALTVDGSASTQPANITQLAGNAISVGNGVSGTGVQRVTIASDSTGQIALAAGSAVIGHVITDATSVTTATLSAETTKVIGTVRSLGNGGATFDSTVGAGTAPANQVVAGALYNSTEISPSTGQAFALQADSKGRLRNVIMDAAGNTRGANVDANNNLNVGQATAANLNATVVQGTATNLKAQVVGATTPADALALGTTSVEVIAKSSVYNGTTTDLAREVANGTNSTGTGIPGFGNLFQCDDTSPTAITENSFGNARMDCANHSQLITPVPSATAGGTTLTTLTLANTTNATNVKASAGQLYSISGFNMSSATPVWISLYNNSGTPTCGTSIIQQFLIPGSTTGTGFVYPFDIPKGFATGIAFCATTGIAGTGAPAASTYVVNFDYK